MRWNRHRALRHVGWARGGVNPIPEYIGKYKSESEIGQGGFAVVYKAKDPALNRDVAIKVLRSAWALCRSAKNRM